MRESNKHLLTGLDAENTDVAYHELEGGDLKGFIKNPISRIRGAMKGVRDDYPPKVREFRENKGKKDIVSMSVFRRPLSKAVNTAMNIASMGDWEKQRKEKGFDAFYHLGLIVNIKGEGNYVIEKNAVIEVRKVALHNISKQGQSMTVPLGDKEITVNEMFNKAEKAQGKKFFHYNPFDNNCQVFVSGLLRAVGLLSSELKDFIFQDVSSIVKDLSPFAQKLAPAITNIGGVADRLIEGEGFAGHTMDSLMDNELGGAFFDSFKPATFKRSFNSAMDILSLPAKAVSTLVPGSGLIINPVVNTRLKHKGEISSMFRKPPSKEVVVKKDTTEDQKSKLAAHSAHHSREHINMMNKAMMDGKSFDEAHQLAQRLVGR